MGNVVVELQTRYGERTAAVSKHGPSTKPRTFSWAACAPGSTLAVLYAEKGFLSNPFSTIDEGIVLEDLDNVYIFKANLEMLLKTTDNLLRSSASDHDPVCYSCGKAAAEADGRDQDLKACGKCQKALYCSRECQLADWSGGGHKGLCKQMVVLENLVKVLSSPYDGHDVDFLRLQV
jgi:hypothetical protein